MCVKPRFNASTKFFGGDDNWRLDADLTQYASGVTFTSRQNPFCKGSRATPACFRHFLLDQWLTHVGTHEIHPPYDLTRRSVNMTTTRAIAQTAREVQKTQVRDSPSSAIDFSARIEPNVNRFIVVSA